MGDNELSPPSRKDNITRLVQRALQGDQGAESELLREVHEELVEMAHDKLRGERRGHTLETHDLVDETYRRLFREPKMRDAVPGREYFFAAVARAMRQILVDHARKRDADKRSGKWVRVPLDDALASWEKEQRADVVELHELLEELKAIDPESHKVLDLQYFAGLDLKEIATLVALSYDQVWRKSKAAKAWLKTRLRRRGEGC
jgi:RNA polymerase sigma factor (TIGR02999 family)